MIQRLPFDVWFLIMKFCDLSDIYNLRRSCRQLQSFPSDRFEWRELQFYVEKGGLERVERILDSDMKCQKYLQLEFLGPLRVKLDYLTLSVRYGYLDVISYLFERAKSFANRIPHHYWDRCLVAGCLHGRHQAVSYLLGLDYFEESVNDTTANVCLKIARDRRDFTLLKILLKAPKIFNTSKQSYLSAFDF